MNDIKLYLKRIEPIDSHNIFDMTVTLEQLNVFKYKIQFENNKIYFHREYTSTTYNNATREVYNEIIKTTYKVVSILSNRITSEELYKIWRLLYE